MGRLSEWRWSARPALVGDTMISVLEERQFPVSELYRAGEQSLAGQERRVRRQAAAGARSWPSFDFSRADIGLFSAGGEISAEYAPKAAAAGCVVIDNTSQFRYEDDIPLVVPEVNPHAIAQYRNRGIIANPNCSTIQMVVALKPIYDAVGIERINVATYQSVSGAGKRGARGTGRAERATYSAAGRSIRRAWWPSRLHSIVCRRSTVSRTTATPRKR